MTFKTAEEQILRAFSQARDMFIFTNRRYVEVDTKGFTGQRVKYESIPYRHINAYEFETAGHMDRDAEIYCYTTIADVKNTGFPVPPRRVGILRTKQSILVKSTDIYEIGYLMNDHTLFGDRPQEGEVKPEIEITF